ncbi:MAG: hypothetical protein N3E49_03250 [Bacteroidia bacterium]|nr:hypothetical protein [Bacteroidia bacterium]
MKAAVLSLAALCWAQAQVLSTALYKYYSESDIAEVQEKTPLKWEGIKYEFSESYEVIAPPGASPQEVEAFHRQVDPRLFERHEIEDREYQVGAYKVVIKSLERCRAEVCARWPQVCQSTPNRPITSKAAGL